jgi:hypothetical protein
MTAVSKPKDSSGTIDTPQGPTTWTLDAPGHLKVQGEVNESDRAITVKIGTGASRMTFAITDIEETPSSGSGTFSGTATFSGSVAEPPAVTGSAAKTETGAATQGTFHWTGRVDLVRNPFDSPILVIPGLAPGGPYTLPLGGPQPMDTPHQTYHPVASNGQMWDAFTAAATTGQVYWPIDPKGPLPPQ